MSYVAADEPCDREPNYAIHDPASIRYTEPKEVVEILEKGEWFKNPNAKTTKKCDFLYKVQWQGGVKNGEVGMAWENELMHEKRSIGVEVQPAGTPTGDTQAREELAKKGDCPC